MEPHDLIRELHDGNDTKIVLVVADGLGGLPPGPGGKTELESARTPHLDALARDGVCGLSVPVLPGVTPGSGPGHLALFGYDPLRTRIGRGVLEALGINFEVAPEDVAARGNFCTVDDQGRVADRRAGRPTTERCVELCQTLNEIAVPGVEVFVEPVREHRFVAVFRGADLGDAVNDTDPQAVGVAPLEARGRDAASARTAAAVNAFVAEAARALADQRPTNMVTLRGLARPPQIATLPEVTGMRCAALAVYPMYRGIARLAGMTALDAGSTLREQIDALRAAWDEHDFFFLHYKYTDSTGEDGNFAAKAEMIERLDGELPAVRALRPDVLVVTGDHSTPSLLRRHSWHPVPTVLWARTCRPDAVTEFGESQCLRGGLGQFEAKHLLTLMMAHAGRLGKFGA
jgi:2,3-bisphosphoglycerate-independent phosphoglycerate mutase